jgi:hypothetical protein
MKRVLIISPYFPPSNAADMQRIRMSLPYFKELGWEAEIVTVHTSFNDLAEDPLLLESVPNDILVHKVKALSKKWTSKLGLGSIALRSLWFYKTKVNHLVKAKKFDLIYFSTTQFPICILGAYWKKKFNIPYIIDMQDPWFSDYYENLPKEKRPKKYWFSYRLNKYLEPIAMKYVDGLISVSDQYIKQLQERYPRLKKVPAQTITFGAFDIDFKIANKHDANLNVIFPSNQSALNIVYVGRGGYDMQTAVEILFSSFKYGLNTDPDLFGRLRFHFIGTSYAPDGKGTKTIYPIAEKFGVASYVNEHTDRIGFYQSLKNLKSASGLLIIGSNDNAYTASKLYPYILTEKPLLAILSRKSSAYSILETCNAGELIMLEDDIKDAFNVFKTYIEKVAAGILPATNWNEFEKYTSFSITKQQVELFNEVLECS